MFKALQMFSYASFFLSTTVFFIQLAESVTKVGDVEYWSRDDISNYKNKTITIMNSCYKKCGVEYGVPKLYKYTLENVLCNDGTPATYYYAKSPKSRRWIVFLDGGGFCSTVEECHKRANKSIRFVSSKKNSNRVEGNGILEMTYDNSNMFWRSNMIYIPYCSSDMYLGNTHKASVAGYHFMGSQIVMKTIMELINHGMGTKKNTQLFLTGSSAGGIGVLANIDRIAMKLKRMKKGNIIVRGIVDSAWYLPLAKTCSMSQKNCLTESGMKKAMHAWRGRYPQYCNQKNVNCLYGVSSVQHIKSPLFIIQNQFDIEQMALKGIWPPDNYEKLARLKEVGEEVRKQITYENGVKAFFLSSCMGHNLLSVKSFHKVAFVKISENTDVAHYKSLESALSCWIKNTFYNSSIVIRSEHNSLNYSRYDCSMRLSDTSYCTSPNCNEYCEHMPNFERRFGRLSSNLKHFSKSRK
uniref:Notum n=1 Tax=Hofstenia miamia TaxID=442651 RepID=A0A068CNH5_HOFMI|nr:notum [Hofstenia miamia]